MVGTHKGTTVHLMSQEAKKTRTRKDRTRLHDPSPGHTFSDTWTSHKILSPKSPSSSLKHRPGDQGFNSKTLGDLQHPTYSGGHITITFMKTKLGYLFLL
jgi:hypothetical protein